MRIFILVSKFYPWVGGTETQTEMVASELNRKGHTVNVLTRLFPKSGFPKREKRGFGIRRFDVYSYPRPLHYIVHFCKALNEIRKNRKSIDILFCMQLTPNGLIGITAKKLFGIPTIAYVRGADWYFSKKEFFGRMIISQVLKRSDLILVQTGKIKREVLEEFPKTRIKVIPNGIYPYEKKATGKNVIYVGNLFERKGIRYLISAMKGLDEKLVIAGNGPMESELKKQAEGRKNIRFTGYIPTERVRDFMCENGKILVLPAIRGEGLPNVILEAMSVGIPVIATRVAGIPDVVKDGETGILVEPRDSEALREAILKLSRDERLRKKMSANCLREIRKYYWDNIIKQLEDVMVSVAKH
jgi:glycosyltransferase involved in cell wall biosynthesis